MAETTTEPNSRSRRAGGIILLACIVIGIILFALANLGIIAAGLFILLLVALVVLAVIGIGIAVFAIPVYIMKDTKVEPGTYELDDVAAVNDTKDH
ncbi:hypothetical protein [Methanogenium organophilum]|uniref:Uncharacterized protein n=1 Tax=Methanogenium organophilum TaxID=2199 RepID=A0A9X9S2Q0_METOG|nr:hypothetical protein [Methanogenium organophilum]WAI00441.1 hypothetical protein OU421_08350 [Methanogenium organophilum]